MNTADASLILKNTIRTIHEDTRKEIKPNIYRGHSRSISTDIEDNITLFISNVLPDNFKFLVDSSVRLVGRSKRPDLLITNQLNEVVAMIEVKSNMGYCRDASGVIDSIIENDNSFRDLNKFTCKFSFDENQEVTYSENVKLFLISLTDGNCSQNNHINNKEYSRMNGVGYFCLFNGWYGDLSDHEIIEFAEELKTTCQL